MTQNIAMFDLTNAATTGATAFTAMLALTTAIVTVTTKAIVIVKAKR